MDIGAPCFVMCQKKGGSDAYVVEALAGWVDSLGMLEATIQRDNESAIRDLIRKVAPLTIRIQSRTPIPRVRTQVGRRTTVEMVVEVVRGAGWTPPASLPMEGMAGLVGQG